MLGVQFYNEAIRKTVISFGTLFNNIELKKTIDGQTIEVEKVPLAYGPKQKFLYRLEGNSADGRKVAMTIPRLYFEMVSVEYDGARKTAATQKYKTTIDGNGEEVRTQYVPVPYNIGFEVGVIAKSQDDGLQILEQILPFFQPSLNISVKFIPNMDEEFISLVSNRYIELFEKITNQNFERGDVSNLLNRVENNIMKVIT